MSSFFFPPVRTNRLSGESLLGHLLFLLYALFFHFHSPEWLLFSCYRSVLWPSRLPLVKKKAAGDRVMREAAVYSRVRGLIKSNRKHAAAFSHWQPLWRCLYLCQGFPSHRFVCVCVWVSKEPWYFSVPRPYQLIRPVHFIWCQIRGRSSAQPLSLSQTQERYVCV